MNLTAGWTQRQIIYGRTVNTAAHKPIQIRAIMRIIAVDTYLLESKLERPFGWSQGWIDRRSIGLVKIATDEGLVGWGEGCSGAAHAVVTDLAPLLLGEDPMQRNLLWQRMYGALHNANTGVGFGASAISALDIALWDLAGKASGLPIHELLGGRVRDRIAVYATGLYYTEGEFPDRLLNEARGYVDAGYTGMKTKVGGLAVEEDVRRVAAIRAAIGPEVKLMVDANQCYNAATAIRIGRRLAEYDIFWFEEPVPTLDVDSCVQVKAALPMAIAGGEVLRTRYEYRNALLRNCFDIIQPDVGNVGGISEMRNVAMTANTFGVQVNPHVWGSSVMIAATLHVASTLPPCPPARSPQPYVQEPVMEFDRTPNAIRDELCDVVFNLQDSFVDVPMSPGLGVKVDERALARLAVHSNRMS